MFFTIQDQDKTIKSAKFTQLKLEKHNLFLFDIDLIRIRLIHADFEPK